MSDLHLGPIGQISLLVTDTERSVQWYRDVLGLPHLYTFGDLAFFDCGGTRLFLSKPEDGVFKPSSVIYFTVGDINQAYQEMKNRKVEFAAAPHLIFRHPSGMEEWMAFFKDPDGQLLGLMSQVSAS